MAYGQSLNITTIVHFEFKIFNTHLVTLILTHHHQLPPSYYAIAIVLVCMYIFIDNNISTLSVKNASHNDTWKNTIPSNLDLSLSYYEQHVPATMGWGVGGGSLTDYTVFSYLTHLWEIARHINGQSVVAGSEKVYLYNMTISDWLLVFHGQLCHTSNTCVVFYVYYMCKNTVVLHV